MTINRETPNVRLIGGPLDDRPLMPGLLKYRGDHTSTLLGSVVGPTTYGEYCTIVLVRYDAELDETVARTVVGFNPDRIEILA
jgi:hypothetical protein